MTDTTTGWMRQTFHGSHEPAHFPSNRLGNFRLIAGYNISIIHELVQGKTDRQGGVQHPTVLALELREAARQIDEGEALGDADPMQVVKMALKTQGGLDSSWREPQQRLESFANMLDHVAAFELPTSSDAALLLAFLGGLVAGTEMLEHCLSIWRLYSKRLSEVDKARDRLWDVADGGMHGGSAGELMTQV